MRVKLVLYVNAKTTALIGPILHKVSFIKMKSSMQHYWLRQELKE